MAKPFFFLLLPSLVSAYSWQFTNSPAQCQDVSIQVVGAGNPPYRVLIIPFGPSPLPNNVEARRIISQNFTGNDNTVKWQLNYPANSQLVAVVSDASGFGSGGTSVAAQVAKGSSAGCFDASTSVFPPFVFNIEPPNQVVQCMPMRLWWDPAQVQGIPQFMAVIPGGQSFQIPVPAQLTTVPNQGIGFNWTPSVRGGTTLIIVAGDDRGPGTGGSVLNTVSFGPNPVSGCLSDSSPSSTPGDPAGGSYPTNSAGASAPSPTKNAGNKKSNNVGPIVGGVLGGMTALVCLLLAFLFYRRYRSGKPKQNQVDLLQGSDDENRDPNEFPPFYQPAPFAVPEPSNSRSSFDPFGRPTSMATSTSDWGLSRIGRSSTPETALLSNAPLTGATAEERKSSSGPSALRPVNIIQHDDAGPSDAHLGEPETIELPPAYTNIKRPGTDAAAAASPGQPSQSA